MQKTRREARSRQTRERVVLEKGREERPPNLGLQQTEKERQEWLNELVPFIAGILNDYLGMRDVENFVSNERAITIWAKAFTHESYSSTFNYETLEYLGDRVAGAAFTKMILKQYEKVTEPTPSQLTELNATYNSRKYQADFCNTLKLYKYLRIIHPFTDKVVGHDDVNINLRGDLYEAFLGALQQVGDLPMNGEVGFILVYNMTLKMFDPIHITLTAGRIAGGHQKSQVRQIFNLLRTPGESLRDIRADVVQTGTDNFVATITLDNEHLNLLKKHGVLLTDPTIGRSTAKSRKSAEMQAFSNALATLQGLGINIAWARELEEKQTRERLKDVWEKALIKAGNHGFVDLKFSRPSQLSENPVHLMTLIGVRENRVEVPLIKIVEQKRGEKSIDMKRRLLEEYINRRAYSGV
jgi:dsRNA-specific ribonuclease